MLLMWFVLLAVGAWLVFVDVGCCWLPFVVVGCCLVGWLAGWAGLGWDGFHPKQILNLPEGYQRRVIDVLHSFEDRPEVLSELLTRIVFLDKPDVGAFSRFLLPPSSLIFS